MFSQSTPEKDSLEEKKPIIYRHFRRLLNELINTTHFIELDEQNYHTFSINNSNLIKETCGYIDSIYGLLKISSQKKGSESNASHLYRYFKENKSRDLALLKITTSAGDRWPWKGDLLKGNLYKFSWWDANNSLKHAYYNETISASLSNLVDSLGAFLILILHLFEKDPYGNIFNENDVLLAIGPGEKTAKSYFQPPQASIEEKIWTKVIKETLANTQKPTPPKPTMGKL